MWELSFVCFKFFIKYESRSSAERMDVQVWRSEERREAIKQSPRWRGKWWPRDMWYNYWTELGPTWGQWLWILSETSSTALFFSDHLQTHEYSHRKVGDWFKSELRFSQMSLISERRERDWRVYAWQWFWLAMRLELGREANECKSNG